MIPLRAGEVRRSLKQVRSAAAGGVLPVYVFVLEALRQRRRSKRQLTRGGGFAG